MISKIVQKERSEEIPEMESRILINDDTRLKEPIVIKNGKYLPPNEWYNNYKPNWFRRIIDSILYGM